MKFIKILLTTFLILLCSLWLSSFYLKHTTRQLIGEKNLHEIVGDIKSAPALPDDFKDTYARVYPNIFKQNFNSNFIYGIFGRAKQHSPSRQVANHYWSLFGKSPSRLKRKLHYVGFIWLVESEIKQDKCFDFHVSKLDFLNDTQGFSEAVSYYYKKSPELLTDDEQLEMILKIQNPAIYNCERYPELCAEGVEELKERSNSQTVVN